MTARRIGEIRLVVDDEGRVESPGFEIPTGILEAATSDVIVVRYPGSSVWSGRGQPRRYHGAEIIVYAVRDWTADGAVVANLAAVPIRESKPRQTKALGRLHDLIARAAP